MASHIGRREFLATLGGAAAAWPLAARAQQPAMPVVGFLTPRAAGDAPHLFGAFRQGLQDTGFVERQNVAIEYRFAGNQNQRLPALAADLVQRQVTVIAATSTPAALAAKAATTTIPIVFETGADPVQLGLVASLNRPGGNVTGVTNISHETAAKRVGLIHELLPGAARFAALVNPNNPLLAEASMKETQAAAVAVGRQLEIFTAGSDGEIDLAFRSIAQKRVESLLILPDNLFSSRRVQLVIQAARHGVPAMYYDRAHAEAGGLMSYGANAADVYRQAGVYVGRVLKGEKPADMPVLQPTKFEFVINMQTARAFGITVPPTLLAIADELIE
jgi:putative tryptophan/tyrosine transport system substrate-binding protein